ncbi:MAG TPA: helix-turn-helix domain-containing protein [Thermoanaerobaculia bacterium]|jgi:sugar-specific transcriptional regulator TrmB
MSSINDAQEHLEALGFSRIEAAAYTFLLQESPATAYRVAQGLGKSNSNAYKAIESLVAKGAVIVDDSSSRMCRAVPAAEVLRTLDRRFTNHKRAIEQSLASVSRATSDDRMYQLTNAEQVLERCRAVLRRATQLAAFDIFPAPLAALREDIERAAKRGVRVALLVYEPVKIPGAVVIVNYRAGEVLGRWPGAWLNLVADSAECVLALLSHDLAEVQHAAWSASAFLAHLYDSGLFGEMANSLLRRALAGGKSAASMRAQLRNFDRCINLASTGYKTLAKKRPK